MSKLECKDFTVQYFGYEAAISGITTDFSFGMNVILAGAKGGKTTFLKGIAGVIPYKGELLLDGENLSEVPLKKRDFQMLFDDYALFTRHSARYNLEYPLKLRKVPKADRRRRVEEAIKLFDLDLMVDAPVYRLNEWHKVSLVLCRAYLREAKVLLIDNIFSRLDPQSREEAFLRYLPIFANRGIVIYATDDSREAAALSKNIKLFSYGYLLQEGSAEEFVSRPACLSAFTAFGEYVSALPCRLFEGGMTLFEREFSTTNLSLLSDEYYGKEAIAAFRPEDFVPSEEGIRVAVQGKLYRGKETVYSARIGEYTLFFLSDAAHSVGDIVPIGIKNVSAIFDAINLRSIVRN